MNGKIKFHFGNCITTDKTLRLFKFTSEAAALFYGSKTWIINNRDAKTWKQQKLYF